MSPPLRPDLGWSMAAGAGWTVLLRLLDRVIGLVSLSILARLLLPEDFGLVALAISFIGLIEMFGQLGVDLRLIQNQQAERRHYDSAWTINVITAVSLSAVLVLLAPEAADFFDEPRVTPIVYWLALGNVIRGLENIGVVDFRKHLEFSREFTYLFTARVLSTIVTLAAAFYLREYWALVLGSVAQAAIRVGLSYRVHPYRPRLSFSGVADILSFSRWVLLQNIIHGINERASAIAIGRFSGPQALAHFNMAHEISNVATSELAAPIRRAIFPGFSKMAADIAALRHGFVRTLAIIVLVGLPIPVGIALTADSIVAVLLGPQWIAAVPLIQVLSIHGMLRTIGTGSYVVYLALGRSHITAVLSAVRLAVLLPLVIVGAREAGAIGAAWALVATAGLLWAVDASILFRMLGLKASELVAAMWRPGVAVLAMSGVIYSLQSALSRPETVFAAALELCASVAVGALIYCSATYVLWRASRCPEGAESMIRNMLQRQRAV